MKKILLLPTIFLPYTFCLIFGYISANQNMSYNTEISFIIPLITLFFSFVCNSIYIFTTKNISATQILRTALIIKAIHIPAYILIFLIGAIMGLMIFMTLPFILFLVLIDFIFLFMSGMISIYAHIKALKEKQICPSALLIISLICQAFFCADIVSLFVINIIAKKQLNS